MDDEELYFNKIDRILDKEEAYLLESERDHHTSWDNHILTLSTAAIGFCFTFLIIRCPNQYWLFFVGVGAFTLAIASAMLNYIVSQRGLKIAQTGNLQRRHQNNEVRRRIHRLQREVNKIGAKGDPAEIRTAKDQCAADVERLYTKYDWESEQNRTERNNNIIGLLNFLKTVLFLAGMICISVFASINLGELAKGL